MCEMLYSPYSLQVFFIRLVKMVEFCFNHKTSTMDSLIDCQIVRYLGLKFLLCQSKFRQILDWSRPSTCSNCSSFQCMQQGREVILPPPNQNMVNTFSIQCYTMLSLITHRDTGVPKHKIKRPNLLIIRCEDKSYPKYFDSTSLKQF